jgi:excisionase family DNA binding protein
MEDKIMFGNVTETNEKMKAKTDASAVTIYTVKEVAAMLKTNVDYVHRLRKAGLLPFLKLGQYKVRKQSLENFLKEYEGKDLTDPFEVKEMS